MGRPLTDKQKMFVLEYLVDLNATQAAIRAGYSERTANRIGPQLLVKSCIQEALKKAMDERSKRVEITADMVLKEIAKLGFSNMKQFAKWGPNGVRLIHSDELTEDQAACVAEVSESTTEFGGTVKFKLHDKKGALELLGKHLGMFKDNVNLNTNLSVQIVDDIK